MARYLINKSLPGNARISNTQTAYATLPFLVPSAVHRLPYLPVPFRALPVPSWLLPLNGHRMLTFAKVPAFPGQFYCGSQTSYPEGGSVRISVYFFHESHKLNILQILIRKF